LPKEETPLMDKSKHRLKMYCERAKIILSNSNCTSIELESFWDDKDLSLNITKNKFEYLCNNLFNNVIESLNQALIKANESNLNIDKIVLVGGSTMIPKIRELVNNLLEKYFPNNNNILCNTINPREATVYGAAVQAATLYNSKSDKILLDRLQLSLGIETKEFVQVKEKKEFEQVKENFLLYFNSIIKFINENIITKDDKTTIDIKIKEVKDWLADNKEKDEYEVKLKELKEWWQPLILNIYSVATIDHS
jgi:molecular chaperone DnaK (HSP70)